MRRRQGWEIEDAKRIRREHQQETTPSNKPSRDYKKKTDY